ncbi:hypothetical protein P691DRAFT_807322 [Macrolepiota fuliginosa MF-IS2]|uniref:Uncharacterized protein n=1 Tax=Macrolepiota fuliginosa MF-IS2 TaxID=1400762 RepID=A0A9P5X4L7_9AGAR|nr:hypothetical protein P691DRAFT_810255 [Macrolepiota fuliginosa MF-IS2]KAF9444484.1 hypothetical protein P691DRAFT_807322 [Macrolepiota fuliginosa MF-IS2]
MTPRQIGAWGWWWEGIKSRDDAVLVFSHLHLLSIARRWAGSDGFLRRCLGTHLPVMTISPIQSNQSPLSQW